jgi:hypothetical protein
MRRYPESKKVNTESGIELEKKENVPIIVRTNERLVFEMSLDVTFDRALPRERPFASFNQTDVTFSDLLAILVDVTGNARVETFDDLLRY